MHGRDLAADHSKGRSVMKKTMIALALIGMAGTAVAQVQVSPPSVGGGSVTTPSIGGGTAGTPPVGVPSVRTPSVQTPNAPGVQTPNVGAGSVTPPTVGSGGVATPGVPSQTVTTPGVTPPSVAVNPPTASTMTEAQARARITAQGYRNIQGLSQDASGHWKGTATLNGKSAAVSVDGSGAVSVQQ
jgi:hypothetical protein